MEIEPLADRMVVRPIKTEETTASGLIIPDTAQEKPQQAEVVSVGPGRTGEDGKFLPMYVKRGQRILHPKYCGDEFEIRGDKFIVLSQEDVLAIVKP